MRVAAVYLKLTSLLFSWSRNSRFISGAPSRRQTPLLARRVDLLGLTSTPLPLARCAAFQTRARGQRRDAPNPSRRLALRHLAGGLGAAPAVFATGGWEAAGAGPGPRPFLASTPVIDSRSRSNSTRIGGPMTVRTISAKPLRGRVPLHSCWSLPVPNANKGFCASAYGRTGNTGRATQRSSFS